MPRGATAHIDSPKIKLSTGWRLSMLLIVHSESSHHCHFWLGIIGTRHSVHIDIGRKYINNFLPLFQCTYSSAQIVISSVHWMLFCISPRPLYFKTCSRSEAAAQWAYMKITLINKCLSNVVNKSRGKWLRLLGWRRIRDRSVWTRAWVDRSSYGRWDAA